MSRFEFVNPNAPPPAACSLAPHCGCHGFRAPDPTAVARHEAEHTRRLAWCVSHGRVPAHEHVHEAPGDDTQFVYGVPPWHPDGSPNPQGIYFTPAHENEREWVRLEKAAADAGWSCPRCAAWILRVPREYRNGPEPWDWRFCDDCKTSHNQTARQGPSSPRRRH